MITSLIDAVDAKLNVLSGVSSEFQIKLAKVEETIKSQLQQNQANQALKLTEGLAEMREYFVN